jgi:uncharacterized protein (DUF433 family)
LGWRHDFDPISHHFRPPQRNMTQGKRTMPRKQSEAERARAQHADLTKQYRAIGLAAVQAALICSAKKRSANTTKTVKAA